MAKVVLALHTHLVGLFGQELLLASLLVGIETFPHAVNCHTFGMFEAQREITLGHWRDHLAELNVFLFLVWDRTFSFLAEVCTQS